jgi:DMSO/TMAO reductase YedYZ molybdopterin-dependent catalytic subunit
MKLNKYTGPDWVPTANDNNDGDANVAGHRRRNFLRLGLVAIGSSFLTACDRLSNTEGFGKFLRTSQNLTMPIQKALAGRKAMAQEFTEADIKAPFRSNGATDPQGMKYKALVADNFASWKLEVGGLVEKPMAFSLDELKAMPSRTQITRHDCVEGWSQIAKWQGVPLHQLLAMVKPLPEAKFVVFRCLDWVDAEDDEDVDGPDAEDSSYYESIDMDDAFHAQTILAYQVNDKPLPVENGAPIRLRVERQLGYKQAKYLMKIELVNRFDKIRGGNGGYWEDKGYEWYAGI